MKLLKMIAQNSLVKSDRFSKIIIEIVLACSAIIIVCEFYILHKL